MKKPIVMPPEGRTAGTWNGTWVEGQPLYHGTRREYRDQIMRDGLVPGTPKPFDPGPDDEPFQHGIFLATDPDEAAQWAGDGDIWEVDTRGLPIEPDLYSYNQNGEDDNFVCTSPIPPDRLRLVGSKTAGLWENHSPFQMPTSVEQAYVRAMECPMCHSNLLLNQPPPKDASKVYCPVCGWTPRKDRTAASNVTFNEKLIDDGSDGDETLEIFVDGEPVGYVNYEPLDSDPDERRPVPPGEMLYLNAMAIDPAYKRKGYATMLIDELLRRKGITKQDLLGEFNDENWPEGGAFWKKYFGDDYFHQIVTKTAEWQSPYGDHGSTEETARFQPGESVVMMNGYESGTIVGEPVNSYEGVAYYVNTYDQDGPRGIELWAESLLHRPDRYDEPEESTLQDWFGIPPEGEQYYRTAAVPQGMTVNFKDYDFNGESEPTQVYEAQLDGKTIGQLHITMDDQKFRISNVWVAPEYQRMGIASYLLQYATKDIGEEIKHDVGPHLSPEGQKWRRAIKPYQKEWLSKTARHVPVELKQQDEFTSENGRMMDVGMVQAIRNNLGIEPLVYNAYDGERRVGSIVFFELKDRTLLSMIPGAPAEPVIWVEWVWVDPEYRDSDVFFQLAEPAKEMSQQTGYPIEAFYQNEKLKRVMDRYFQRSLVAAFDAPLESPVGYTFVPFTDQELEYWQTLPEQEQARYKRQARSLNQRAQRKQGVSGTIVGRDLALLSHRYQGKCAYCGLPGADSWDHVIPMGIGGQNEINNILPAHIQCNKELNDWANRNRDYRNPVPGQMSPYWFEHPAEAKVSNLVWDQVIESAFEEAIGQGFDLDTAARYAMGKLMDSQHLSLQQASTYIAPFVDKWLQFHDKLRNMDEKGEIGEDAPYDVQWTDMIPDLPGKNWTEITPRRVGMAERTGDPELDALIDQFMKEEYQYLCGGEVDPENAADYRNPEDAYGQCWEVSTYFANWLNQHGMQANLPEDEPVMQDMPWTQEKRDPHPWDYSYNDMPGSEPYGYRGEDYDPSDQHHVVIVRRPSGTYMIDFTAAQFGYTEFPMVQRFDQGQWQRQWTSAVGDSFNIGDRILGETDEGRKEGEIIEVPDQPGGYYRVRWDDGTENVMTWGYLQHIEDYNAWDDLQDTKDDDVIQMPEWTPEQLDFINQRAFEQHLEWANRWPDAVALIKENQQHGGMQIPTLLQHVEWILYETYQMIDDPKDVKGWAKRLVDTDWSNVPVSPEAPTEETAQGLWPDTLPWGEQEQDYYRHAAELPTWRKLQPHQGLRDLAQSYMDSKGWDYDPPRTYPEVDESRAKAIADEYDRMTHAPNDPYVRSAYSALAGETLDQYNHLVDNGYTFEFEPEEGAYNSPWDASRDVRDNKHIYVYPTSAGFGSEETGEHPLLEPVPGMRWNDKPVTYNDLFRGVHDVFGHAKEGMGFRHHGEENAWRQHSAMYSDMARRALTSETRGQNSWVNFGPHGEHNQMADQASTIYAPQKAGLLPEWVTWEGAHDH